MVTGNHVASLIEGPSPIFMISRGYYKLSFFPTSEKETLGADRMCYGLSKEMHRETITVKLTKTTGN